MAVTENQREVITFLRDPANYGPDVENVETIATHISIVFLAGARAYKLKRAVKFHYLDFSTAELREKACRDELHLNRRTAPELYLDTQPICRSADGRLGWGDGDRVDTVVVMRRFDQDRLLDAVALAGGLDTPLLNALAAHIAAFHAEAEQRPDMGGAVKMANIAAQAMQSLREIRAVRFDAEQLKALNRAWLAESALLAPLLDHRRDVGKVRRCHGDLHLRNICLLDGKPVLFDCIEFSEAISTIDVLYDLAFLVMDLAHRGRRGDANRLLNRYLDLTAEDDGLGAMPFLLSLRAAIRAQVLATALAQDGGDAGSEETARAYLSEASIALRKPAPRLVAIGGPSGSGKSTLAHALAPELGAVPGARVLRSDVLRKRRFGLTPETKLPAEGYAEAVTKAVYADLCQLAAIALRSGYCAIIDAVALNLAERQAFAAVARDAGAAFTGIWLEAPAVIMAERIDGRRGDASDASTHVLAQQLHQDAGPLDWLRIDAGGSLEATLSQARKALIG